MHKDIVPLTLTRERSAQSTRMSLRRRNSFVQRQLHD